MLKFLYESFAEEKYNRGKSHGLDNSFDLNRERLIIVFEICFSMENRFLTNSTEVTFLNKLNDSLRRCTSFCFTVSFIKRSGVELISDALEEALRRGAEGKLITSAYMNFTDIPSLEYFLSLAQKYPNFHCHFDFDAFEGFHCKGYLFTYPLGQEIIIGSSNLTSFALLHNVEWDVSLEDSSLFSAYQEARRDFDRLYQKTYPLDQKLVESYKIRIENAPIRWDMDLITRYHPKALHPNYMQQEALREIARYRDMGEKKALIVAATGSGKTYLAAFDAMNFGAKKLLYVVHQENILRASLKTFQNVFQDSRSYGVYTGNKQEKEADFLFATNQELSRHLPSFQPDDFDYIILDECHHAVASSYQKILHYFHPEFLLGLTATANRMDNQDILSLFDCNIPFQLSLADAMNNGLIVGFRYFAISDPMVDYSLDKTDTAKMVKQISSPENARFIAEQIQNHLPMNGKLKALGFCRTVDHAMQMAHAFAALGYGTTYLTGKDEIGVRQEALRELEDENNPLQIIFTIDIFNEGIDIPSVNMVLFLRPTDSQTIFIQQLGRGLRKYKDKPYLIVLDFIGVSYQRSAQIALALEDLKPDGSTTEKAQLRHDIETDFEDLSLPVEIHFDERAKKEILASLDRINFNRSEYLYNDYQRFKEYLRLSTYPTHMDYLNCVYSPNLMRFIHCRYGGRKCGSYYGFLSAIEEKTIPHFTEEEKGLLVELSSLLPLVRPDDYALLETLLNGDKTDKELLEADKDYGLFKEKQFYHALNYLSGEYFKNRESWCIRKKNGRWHFETSSYSPEFIVHLKDLLHYGLERFRREFGSFESDFLLYHSYSTKQILMVLTRSDCTSSYMKGTIYLGSKGVFLVGLKKDASLEERLKYEDKFLSPSLFQWESETGCTFNNLKGKHVLAMKRVSLFLRKVKEEDGITLPYFYVGEGTMTNPRVSTNPGKTLLFDVVLDKAIEPNYRNDLLVPEEKEK